MDPRRRQELTWYGAPAAFLAAVTIAAILIKAGLSGGSGSGPSTAGALGPMQFILSTWDAYGEGGDINSNHDSILAAARLLVANGAPGDMANAIYHYNPDGGYVTAVSTYAEHMAADDREIKIAPGMPGAK